MVDLGCIVYTQQQMLYVNLFNSKLYDFVLKKIGYVFRPLINLLVVSLCGYETWSVVLNGEHNDKYFKAFPPT